MKALQKVEISDRDWIHPILVSQKNLGCHYNFTNIFAWAEVYRYEVGLYENMLIVRGLSLDQEPYFFFPVGYGKVEVALEWLEKEARRSGEPLVMAGLNTEHKTILEAWRPGSFEIEETRNSFDYVYLTEKMVSLSGKKLQAKRNHINRFKGNYEWSFEVLGDENMKECLEMNKEWCRRHDCADDQHLHDEACAVMRCFQNYKALELEGGLIKANGKIVAFTIADRLNAQTFDVHIEKAFSEYQGAYQIINQSFAQYIQNTHPEVIYLNREEDMGFEGLRQAKMSYQPIHLEEKFWARER